MSFVFLFVSRRFSFKNLALNLSHQDFLILSDRGFLIDLFPIRVYKMRISLHMELLYTHYWQHALDSSIQVMLTSTALRRRVVLKFGEFLLLAVETRASLIVSRHSRASVDSLYCLESVHIFEAWCNNNLHITNSNEVKKGKPNNARSDKGVFLIIIESRDSRNSYHHDNDTQRIGGG